MSVDQFFSKIDTSHGREGCWLWQGAVGSDGYGRLKRSGKTHSAHRYAYETFKGEIPGDLCVLHECDTPLCVNPTHLFLGTKEDNARDMLKKNRQGRPVPHLTPPQVDELRRRALSGESKTDLAVAFGVCRSTVQDIVRGLTWKVSDSPYQQSCLFDVV